MNDRPRSPVLPPDIPFEELVALKEERDRLAEERRLASVAVQVRVDDLPAAQRLDLRDQGAAMRSGAKDPGNRREAKLLREKEEWETKYRVADEAYAQVEAEINELILSRRDSWDQEIVTSAEEARAAYHALLLETKAANERLRATYGILKWIRQYETLKAYKAPTGTSGLRSPAGDPYSLPAVFADLIAEASILPDFSEVFAGPPPADPRIMTQEEARAMVEAHERMQIEQGFAPRPVKPRPVTLPPNSVVGGRNLTP